MILISNVLLLLGFLGGSPESTVPVPLQAALFRKVMAYDETIEKSGGIKNTHVLVLSENESPIASQLVSLLKSIGVNSEELRLADIDKAVFTNAVLFVIPGSYSPHVQKVCDQHRILSFTTDANLVRQGAVAVGLYLDEGAHPKIVVNAGRLSAIGHNLNPSLLALSEVVQ